MKTLSLAAIIGMLVTSHAHAAPQAQPAAASKAEEPAPKAEAAAETEPSDAAQEAAAVRAELDRGLAKLRLEGSPAPYRAQARYTRARLLSLDASFGGVITDVLERQSAGIVELRVGTPARDNANFFGGEGGLVRLGVPLNPSPDYLRRKTWLALDAAFRGASQSFAAKQITLEQLEASEIPPDYTAHEGDTIDVWVEPSADEIPREQLSALAAKMSTQFERWPSIDNGDVHLQVLRTHETILDTDGITIARARDRTVLAVVADTKAADGMHLDHGLAIHLHGLPNIDEAFEAQALTLTNQVLEELDALAKAPMIDEEYDGPILFRDAAAAQLLASTIATEAAGTPAPLADGGRLMDLEPTWQKRFGKNVMPPFVDLIDDPSAVGFGAFGLDAEGIKPAPLKIVERGVLQNLLMTRTPNPKVSGSNGRARMSPSLEVGPTISNLSLVASERRLSNTALERELLRRAREDGYEFAYVIERLRDGALLGPVPRESAAAYAGTGKVSLPLPVRVFRIEAGGKKTLMRGVVLAPASMRVLRRIRAVSNTSTALPMRIPVGPYGGFGADIGIDSVLSQTVDVMIETPDLLIEGMELLVERGEHERAPTLVHPLRRDTGEAEEQ